MVSSFTIPGRNVSEKADPFAFFAVFLVGNRPPFERKRVTLCRKSV